MNPIRENVINELLDRINYYEGLAKELLHAYSQIDSEVPDDVRKRIESLGTLTDGIHEAIRVIYEGRRRDE